MDGASVGDLLGKDIRRQIKNPGSTTGVVVETEPSQTVISELITKMRDLPFASEHVLDWETLSELLGTDSVKPEAVLSLLERSNEN